MIEKADIEKIFEKIMSEIVARDELIEEMQVQIFNLEEDKQELTKKIEMYKIVKDQLDKFLEK